MRFELRPDEKLIVYHDSQPGEHATLFAPNGQRMRFRDDRSHFSDQPPVYSWAFEGTVQEGDRIVFATADREVLGVVRPHDVEASLLSGGQVIHAGDKPSALTGDLLPTIEQLLKPPHPESPPRPIPLYVGTKTISPPQPSTEVGGAHGPWIHVGGLVVRCPRGTFKALTLQDAVYIAAACEAYPRLMAEIERLRR